MLLLIASAFALDADVFTTGAVTWDPAAFTRLGSTGGGEPGDWDAGLVMDYADAPVSETTPAGRSPVLDALATAAFMGSYSFGGVRVDAALPVHAGVDAGGGFAAAGDARLGAQLAVPGVRGVAMSATVLLPTGADARLVGGPPRLVAAARASRELGSFVLLGVAGAVCSLPEEVRGTEAAVGPLLGFGAGYQVSDALSAQAEIEAEGPWGLTSIPVEATVSTRMRLPSGVSASLGAAAGLGDGVGASRWRAIVGIGFSDRVKSRRVEAELASAAEAQADRDGDGVVGSLDACPDQPETVDGFTDGDGCPELDGDGDGVAFERDACPTEAILASQDPRTSDGCPHVVELAGDRLAIVDAVFFKEGRAELLPSVDPILLAVSEAIRAHPEIPMFLVEGHANTDGPDAYNQRLSEARAAAVTRWLAQHGVDPQRLVARGYGEARPLLPADAPEALAMNRRVEFRVLRVEDLPAGDRHLVLPPEVR